MLGGVEYRLDDRATFGLIGGYGSGNPDYPDNTGSFDVDLYSVTSYAGSEFGNLFFIGSASYGWIDYDDIVRAFDLYKGRVYNHAETSGHTISAYASTGYQVIVDQNRVIPFASIAYQKVDVNGYTESGLDWATMRFEDQRRGSLVGTFGLQLKRTAEIAANSVNFWLNTAYNRDFRAEPRNIPAGLTAAKGLMFTFPYDIGPEEWLSLSGVLQPEIGAGIELSVRSGLRISSGEIDNVWGGISLSVPLN